LLGVPQLLLNPSDLRRVAGVLAQVITKLDGRAAVRCGDFDDDVERFGLFAIGLVGEIIWEKLDITHENETVGGTYL
jgi:hypothetical protein